jgi:hypothetical protein
MGRILWMKSFISFSITHEHERIILVQHKRLGFSDSG